MTNDKYDLVIVGATGFTGRLVAEYLMSKYGTGRELRWAVAGRDKNKLDRLRMDLAAPELPLLQVDLTDSARLDWMCSNTRVVCTTAGPYSLYGSELIGACIRNGADYCDLSGEPLWMRRMIDRYHNEATNSGVRVVHSCGFDSIPSDLGVYFLQENAKKDSGSYCIHIKNTLRASRGSPSGGTVASLFQSQIELSEDPEKKALLDNPYMLNPDPDFKGPDSPVLTKAHYDRELKTWVGPFVMAFINAPNVRRSHALAGFCYGRAFRYEEMTMTSPGFKGWLKASSLARISQIVNAARPGTILNKGLKKFLPNPGEGPSRPERETGFYVFKMWGRTTHGKIYRARISGDRDPGYGSTSKIIGEVAVCLARDKDKCPKVSGVITPAYAMGRILLNRLQENAGLCFEMLKD